MRRSRCGFDCVSCPYFKKACIGCVIETCLVDKCIKGTSYTGITHPKSFCRLRPYCPIGGKERPSPVQVSSLGRKQVARIKFPRFIPEIDISDERSWIWREGFQVPAVFVPLWQLLTNENFLSKASSKGLHDYLGFDGKILLSTVMPDELIDRLETKDYFRLIEELRPDATMVPDNYTYTDVPLYQSWSQTIRLVSFANDFLELDIPLIGLVKGANLRQMDWAVRRQVEMGYVSFAMPARELFEEEMLDYFLPQILLTLRRSLRNDFEFLLYGVGVKLWEYKDVSFSNLSWFLRAKHGEYYWDGLFYDLRDPSIRFEECYCEACGGMMPQDIIDLWFDDKERAMRTLAAHNLLDLSRLWQRR
ncbi:MAG: hypothetical protein QXI42_04830 [Thermoproteota archaeon]|nr:hypothetical protein [Candidatus Brockarchaeota archaeon]